MLNNDIFDMGFIFRIFYQDNTYFMIFVTNANINIDYKIQLIEDFFNLYVFIFSDRNRNSLLFSIISKYYHFINKK